MTTENIDGYEIRLTYDNKKTFYYNGSRIAKAKVPEKIATKLDKLATKLIETRQKENGRAKPKPTPKQTPPRADFNYFFQYFPPPLQKDQLISQLEEKRRARTALDAEIDRLSNDLEKILKSEIPKPPTNNKITKPEAIAELNKLGITDLKSWRKWLLSNHPDKFPDDEKRAKLVSDVNQWIELSGYKDIKT